MPLKFSLPHKTWRPVIICVELLIHFLNPKKNLRKKEREHSLQELACQELETSATSYMVEGAT